MVCDKEEEAEDAEAGGTDLKTRTPHNDVGKYGRTYSTVPPF